MFIEISLFEFVDIFDNISNNRGFEYPYPYPRVLSKFRMSRQVYDMLGIKYATDTSVRKA